MDEEIENNSESKSGSGEDMLIELKEEIKRECEKIYKEIHSKLSKDIKEMCRKAKVELLEEKEKLVAEFKLETTVMSFNVTEKLLKQVIDKKIHEKFVDEYLDDLDKPSKEIH